ncbi:MAG: hypothetical protein EOP86_28345 [Verrucomicrobiaceae bacterium]|nr:MAG: hypothetical protein EOP86_28345 [Verrucomicrobiaceae bacterium]
MAVTTIGLNAGERGKMIRVDLYTDTQQPASYDQWADQKFGGHTAPNQLADADFDGDGLSNGNEWRAGTDPKDTSSGLRIVSLGRGADGDSITWESVIGKIYFIEVSADLGKLQPWAAVGGSVTAVNEQSSSTVPRSPGQALRFFRVKVKE